MPIEASGKNKFQVSEKREKEDQRVDIKRQMENVQPGAYLDF